MKKHAGIVLFWMGILFFSPVGAQDKRADIAAQRGDTLMLAPFHSIALGIQAAVFLEQGPSVRVIAKGGSGTTSHLSRVIRDGVWLIEFQDKVNMADSLVLYITLPDIKMVSIGGSGSVACTSPFELTAPLSVVIGGSGALALRGAAPGIQVNIAGSGTLDALQFEVSEGEVHLAGSGEARIFVTKQLEVSVAGNGHVWYKGSPEVKSTVVGSGSVKAVN